MAEYHKISEELQDRIKEDRRNHVENPYAFSDENVTRRNMKHDIPSLWRPTFVSDVEKIMHNPYYNRYADKTQVFSFYKNDDISRRLLHVQLVARIARNIGRVLNLNLDLIEAIALGHDIGHTPFGHVGEALLNELYHEKTGRLFNHNVHSERVLDKLICRNISLQTLDGVICHNGEFEQQEYRPKPLSGFEEFDKRVEACYQSQEANKEMVPSTLEACVMRVCDIIAYLGKDRQDAIRLNMIPDVSHFSGSNIGKTNAEIINNMVVNIIENSYGKAYLCMDEEYFRGFKRAKKENYEHIYGNKEMKQMFDEQIEPMFEAVYKELLRQAKEKEETGILYRHHIAFIKENNRYSSSFSFKDYIETEPNQIVVDYIASMTDDYFLDLYQELFPKGKYKVTYQGYFNKI